MVCESEHLPIEYSLYNFLLGAVVDLCVCQKAGFRHFIVCYHVRWCIFIVLPRLFVKRALGTELECLIGVELAGRWQLTGLRVDGGPGEATNVIEAF